MYDERFATKDERHLMTKIRIFEDMMLRNRRNLGEVEKINKVLQEMRIELQKMQWHRNRA